jgi:hypothetical protein
MYVPAHQVVPAHRIIATSPRLVPVRQPLTEEFHSLAQPRAVGKPRRPWRTWLLCFTVVYPFIWYYRLNNELRECHRRIKVRPGLAVLAVTLGAPLVVPPLVSMVNTARRIQKAQRLAGSAKRCSPLMAIALNVFSPVYVQSQLNSLWEACAPAHSPEL